MRLNALCTPFAGALASALLLLGPTACTSGDGDGADRGDDGTTEPGGPVFLSFGSNQLAMTETSPDLILSAVLTDPDGVDDLVGGSLVDLGTGATYGTFATSAQEGAYSITVSWDALDGVDQIETSEAALQIARQLEARFFDQAGHLASQTISIDLGCARAGDWREGGVCSSRYDLFECLEGEQYCQVSFGEHGPYRGDDACDLVGLPCARCESNGGTDFACDVALSDDADYCLCEQ